MLFYIYGLNYAKAGEIIGTSHEAVRERYQKKKTLIFTSPKERKRIAIDKKEIDLNEKKVLGMGSLVWVLKITMMVTEGRRSIHLLLPFAF